MSPVSRNVAACVLGGLLFFISGCALNPELESAESVRALKATVAIDLVSAATEAPVAASTPNEPTRPDAVSTSIPASTATPIEALPIPSPDGPLYTYHTILEGETLGYLALVYDTEVGDLVAMNNLAGPSALIRTGQTLRVPLFTDNTAPAELLLPDSEVVYSPAYVGFNVAEFVAGQGGYLATYHEYLDNEELSGAEIVERVAEQFSVGPRLLLALLEYYGGWVTQPDPSPEQLVQPLGPRNPRGPDLYLALGFTANRINAGYYGYKRDGFWVFSLADRTQAVTPLGLNAGTVGVQNILAIHSDQATWSKALGPAGLRATYQSLFGDLADYAFEPVVPITLKQPSLALPWNEGAGFYFTGGAHPAYADGSAWAAVDFGPPDVLGNCFFSNEPSTAAVPGIAVVARQGEVQLDLDGDGNIQTGWVLLYLHVALDLETPLQPRQQVEQGDVIGYASCEGGLSNSSHLHFARRYNGEWMAVGGPVPLELDGWVVQPSLIPYEGFIVNGSETREACECWDPEKNLMVKHPAN